jgi:hypothetical protein
MITMKKSFTKGQGLWSLREVPVPPWRSHEENLRAGIHSRLGACLPVGRDQDK